MDRVSASCLQFDDGLGFSIGHVSASIEIVVFHKLSSLVQAVLKKRQFAKNYAIRYLIHAQIPSVSEQ